MDEDRNAIVLWNGGFKSTIALLSAIMKDQDVYPMFVDYGQVLRDYQIDACRKLIRLIRLDFTKEYRHINPLKMIVIYGVETEFFMKSVFSYLATNYGAHISKRSDDEKKCYVVSGGRVKVENLVLSDFSSYVRVLMQTANCITPVMNEEVHTYEACGKCVSCIAFQDIIKKLFDFDKIDDSEEADR